jgi:hypothetical protein
MNGLVLALDAGNPKSYPGSGTTWTDLSGRGNTGTLTNGPTYSSANGGSIVFDGVDDYVDIPDTTFSTTNSITLNVFFNLTGNGFNSPNSNAIISWGPVRIYARNTTNSVTVRTDAITAFQSPGYTLGTNNFNSVNICGIYSGWNGTDYTLTLYQNGTLVGSATSTTQPTLDYKYFLGTVVGLAATFSGKINYASVYNRALSAAEVSQNFNALRGRFGL